jgi:hypothetical protein
LKGCHQGCQVTRQGLPSYQARVAKLLLRVAKSPSRVAIWTAGLPKSVPRVATFPTRVKYKQSLRRRILSFSLISAGI